MCIFQCFSSTTQSSTHNTSSGSDLAQHRAGDARTWYDEINSPLIQQDGNDKCLKLRFDVSQYAPEEIVVKTVDNKLLVCIFTIYSLLFAKVIKLKLAEIIQAQILSDVIVFFPVDTILKAYLIIIIIKCQCVCRRFLISRQSYCS